MLAGTRGPPPLFHILPTFQQPFTCSRCSELSSVAPSLVSPLRSEFSQLRNSKQAATIKAKKKPPSSLAVVLGWEGKLDCFSFVLTAVSMARPWRFILLYALIARLSHPILYEIRKLANKLAGGFNTVSLTSLKAYALLPDVTLSRLQYGR